MIFRFVDIDGIVDHHCLNFLFKICFFIVYKFQSTWVSWLIELCDILLELKTMMNGKEKWKKNQSKTININPCTK